MFKKNSFVWMMALLILLLAPFAVLTFFVWPSSDDYAISYMLSNGNDSIWGLLRVLYLGWGGRYSAWFGTLLSPVGVNHLWIYRGLLLGTFALLLLALRFFWAGVVIGNKVRGTSLVGACVFLLLWLQVAPGIAESFYWYSGVVVYIWPLVGLFFVWGGLLQKNKNVFHTFILGLVAFILTGFNEMAAGLALITGIASIFTIKGQRAHKGNFLFLGVVVVGLILLLASPGNAKRMDLFVNGGNWIDALWISFVSLVKLNGIHLQSLPLWLVALLLFKELTPGIFHHHLQRYLQWNPLLVAAIGQTMLWGLLFVPAWSMGINPPLRVYGFLSPLWLLWFAWLVVSVRWHYREKIEAWPQFSGVGFKAIVLVIALSFMVHFVKVPGGDVVFGGNVPQGWYDLAFRAADYNRQMNSREAVIQEALEKGTTRLGVPALESPPATIFFLDMTSDPAHWINPLYARHYGLEEIWVEEVVPVE